MQLYSRFTGVDLSENKITGTLSSNYQTPSKSIDMSINCLSGATPSSVRHTNSSVSVVAGNLFACPSLNSDSGSSKVSCGSQNYDSSVYTWLGTAAGVAVVLVLVSWKCNSPTASRVKKLVLEWMRASHHHLPLSLTSTKLSLSNPLPHTTRAIEVLDRVSSMSVVLAAVFVLVVMMAYVGLKGMHINAVYQVQYLYTVTAAFFTGSSAAALVWIFILISGALVVMACVRSRPLIVSPEIGTVHRVEYSDTLDTGYQAYQDLLQRLASQSTVVVTMAALAFAVNYGFVMIVNFGHPSNLSATQFAFTLLKLIFGSFLVPISSKLIRREYRAVYSMTMKIVVTTAAPAVAVLLVSPLCLYYRIRPKQISDTYMSATFSCGVNELAEGTCLPSTVPVSVSFTPVWNYSYQCSSSFLVSYLPNFTYLYLINGIIMPLTYFMMTIYSSSTISFPLVEYLLELSSAGDKAPFSSIFAISSNIQESHSSSSSQVDSHSDKSDASSRDPMTKSTIDTRTSSSSSAAARSRYDVEVSDLMSGTCVDITLLLTFGLASPLLAIPICFSIVINSLLLRLALGRYIVIVSDAIGQAACYQKLERAFQGTWKDLSGTITTTFVIIIIDITITIISIRLMGSHEYIYRHILVTVCPRYDWR